MAGYKPVINYKPEPIEDPSDRTQIIWVPRVKDRGQTVPLEKVVLDAIDRSYIVGVKPEYAEAIARGILLQVKACLDNAQAVQFGDMFSVYLYLGGTVENATSRVRKATNPLNARLRQGTGLRPEWNDYEYHNVNVEGELPQFKEITSVGAGALPRTIDKGKAFGIVGDNLTMNTAHDKMTVSWIQDDEPESIDIVPAVNGDGYLQFSYPSAMDDIPNGTVLTFTGTWYKEVEGTWVPFTTDSIKATYRVTE